MTPSATITNANAPRILWVVRHAEREDNINSNWQRNANPNGLRADNSPLSKRGLEVQAVELAKRFSKVPIDHVFASPFERTIQTAKILIGNRNIPIKPEPGLLEALYLCESPPSFEDTASLKQRFPMVDEKYDSIYKKPLPRERYGDHECIGRVQKTIANILERYKDARSFVLVSHGSPIGAIHEVLVDDWNYVGQATVSKFVEISEDSGQFQLEYTSDASHLSDRSNLRAY